MLNIICFLLINNPFNAGSDKRHKGTTVFHFTCMITQ
jgi:hypothetical protein